MSVFSHLLVEFWLGTSVLSQIRFKFWGSVNFQAYFSKKYLTFVQLHNLWIIFTLRYPFHWIYLVGWSTFCIIGDFFHSIFFTILKSVILMSVQAFCPTLHWKIFEFCTGKFFVFNYLCRNKYWVSVVEKGL